MNKLITFCILVLIIATALAHAINTMSVAMSNAQTQFYAMKLVIAFNVALNKNPLTMLINICALLCFNQ